MKPISEWTDAEIEGHVVPNKKAAIDHACTLAAEVLRLRGEVTKTRILLEIERRRPELEVLRARAEAAEEAMREAQCAAEDFKEQYLTARMERDVFLEDLRRTEAQAEWLRGVIERAEETPT